MGRKILQLKRNFIPRGLVPLEKLFDQNDVPTRPTIQPKEEKVQEHNLGTSSDPQMIRLSKDFPEEQKHKYIDIFREFKDISAWKYKDLKSYGTSIIQHKIPLKPGAKPFVQKLRKINPILLPTI